MVGIQVLKFRVFICVFLAVAAQAQQWDVGSRAAGALSEGTGKRLSISFEQRGRYEDRLDSGFGKDPDRATGLLRTRIGLNYTPSKWLKVSAMMQDARAPWYGDSAPTSIHDEAGLQEGYFELFPSVQTGFTMSGGRRMLNYGEGRLIGTPQWGNVSRTYDYARAGWHTRRAHFEMLFVSPVKVRLGEFNRPVLGDHVWGTYNSFPDFYKKNLLEAYVLRRDQNRPGGFRGGSAAADTDRLGVNTAGFRLTGPLPRAVKYSLEAAFQNGKVGPASLRSCAWFGGLSRRWKVAGHNLDVGGEYKYASGTENPDDPTRTGTFDQLYPANHDKFGHQDLFGWRNVHNVRSTTSLGNRNFSYVHVRQLLAGERQGWSLQRVGALLARSPSGAAGRHVGQETDLFGAYKFGHFTFGGGYGHFFSGEFIRQTTPGLGPTYLYVFHSYSL